jgi:hypothetical protein
MHARTLSRSAAMLAAIVFFCVAPIFAQAPLEPAQMPQQTLFYLLWRGAPPSSARAANSLLALWDDPDFAPVRSGLVEHLLSNSKKSQSKNPQLAADEVTQYSALLENAFVIGYLPRPHGSSAEPADSTHKWNGFFFVYDRTGKEALLSKAVLQMRANEKELPTISQTILGGIPVLKIEHKTGTTYWAEHDKYAIASSESAVFEQIAAALAGKTRGNSLAQSAGYQEAQPGLKNGVLEFFLRLPRQADIASTLPATSKAKVPPILDAIHLDAVHCAYGQILLEGSKTRMNGAILGDTTAGSLFDIFGDGQSTPVSLGFVSNDSISYQESQFSFLALYNLAKRAFLASQPPEQQNAAVFIEAMAQVKLGAPLPDVLGNFTGEFASIQSGPVADVSKRTFFIGIRDKAATLKVIHTVMREQNISESENGNATLLDIPTGAKQAGSASAQLSFVHLAVLPDVVLASTSKDTLQTELARRAAPPSSLPAAFQSVRAQFPEKVSGLGYYNFQQMDWDGLKKQMLESYSGPAAKSFAQKESAVQERTPPPAWLVRLDPKVFARHLHVSTSASWKDAKGIHFDGWIE